MAASPPVETPLRTVAVALAVALACALAVSVATVLLRPLYHANIEDERARLVLGLMDGVLDGPLEAVATPIELASGAPAPGVNAATFDADKAARDETAGHAIAPEDDIAGLGRMADVAVVHELRADGALKAVVLPVSGRGYASTLRGYLAIAADGRTIQGLRFYEHGETPGIGGRVDDPAWLAKWRGRLAYDADGRIRIEVVHGAARTASQVDAITGATYTSRGVDNLVRFWLGPRGFGPYLKRIRAENAS